MSISEKNVQADDEVDELDLFMAEIKSELEKEEENKTNKPSKGIREDIEAIDDQETYFKYIDETVIIEPEENDQFDYDSDGNVINTYLKREILPLPLINHSEINYPTFNKYFYDEHNEISCLDETEIDKYRKELGIKISGLNIIKPVFSFAHLNLDELMMEVIRKHQYHKLTPIQSQSIPIILSGRDIIGIAKTGSGKTAAYLIPMMIHVINQPELKSGDGPIALVCAPTRELSQQIYLETKKFAKAYNLTVAVAFGGANKHEQVLALQAGAEIVIATPGRLIDLIKDKATNLRRVTYLVFDEADRMFELGFETQVRSISNNIRPDRQCLLFSATFKQKIEKLCREILTDPLRVVIGEIGEANEDVTQTVVIFEKKEQKLAWVLTNLVAFSSTGNVLIFVTKKDNCVELGKHLTKHDHEVGVIHGDFNQFERDDVMQKFRTNVTKILVATDVAARGLDIQSIKTVINYDVARDITTHTHRIGRTGRAGEQGEAYTLITSEDIDFVPDLVRNLEGANQVVSEELLELAMKNPWFKSQREKHGKNSKLYNHSNNKARPGLGFSRKSDSKASNVMIEEVLQQQTSSSSNKTVGSDQLNNLKNAFSKGYFKFQKSEKASMPGTLNVVATKRSTSDIGNNEAVKEAKRKSRWN